MTFAEAIRTGFHTINTRLQLVGVQAVLMIVNCISFFVVVGIPLGIAFVIFGLDLTGISNAKDVFSMLASPSGLIMKYLWLVLVVVVFVLFYILLVTTLGLYVFSGSAGVVGRSILDPSLPFSMKQFFGEAKQFFFPLMWYSLLASLVFLAIAFMLGLFGGGIAAMVSAAKSQDSTLALFLGIFFSLVLALLAIAVILVFLAVTVYGIAVLYFRREGSWKAFREACVFLWNRPDAFWLYALVFAGYISGSFVVMVISYPFHLIPIIGMIISFPLQLISYMVQGYLGLVVLAVVFGYYYELELKKKAPAVIEPAAGMNATDAGSTTPGDTSALQAHGQDVTLPGMEEKPEG
jgi:hypothetical protein